MTDLETDLSVVVVSHNTRGLTVRCLASTREATRGRAAEVLLVDNASSDGTVAEVRSAFPDVHVTANERNVGYGTACNQGMRLARGRAFLLLNADTEVTGEAIGRLCAALDEEPSVAAVGARLVGPDGRPRPSARRFPGAGRELVQRFRLYRLLPRAWRSRLLLGDHARPEDARRPDWVTGACLLVRREAFERTGGFDESIFLYGEELDFCARLRRAGWHVALVPDAAVVHVGRASSGPSLGPERLALSLEGDLRYLARYRGRPVLAAFCLVRALGLAFEAALAALGADGPSLRAVTYQLRAHVALAPRYLLGRGTSSRIAQ